MSDESIKLKAFISYSRKDAFAFVEQLAAALKAAGIEPMIDRHDISGGEDWKKRIGDLIAAADSVVFAITPESIASEICEWEIAMSDQLCKKLIPVVPAPLYPISPPERLTSLNYIFFFSDPSVPDAGFGKGLADLCAALRTDLDWVRAHTRYGQRAAEWMSGNRAASRLLSGDDVTTAKTWMAERPAAAPEITDDVRKFIDASEEVEIERRSAERKRLQEREETLVKMETALNDTKLAQERAKRYLVGGLVLTLVFAAFGSWMMIEARRSERRANGALDLVGWIGNKNLGGEREATKEQKLAMYDLCNNAIEITNTIANSKESGSERTRNEFWNLYYGSLFVVEIFQRIHSKEEAKIKIEIDGKSKIEASMVVFGKILRKEREGDLVEAAKGVERACREFQEWLKNES